MDNTQSNTEEGNLLLVDDDLPTVQTMEAFLTRHGYKVRCALDGHTALMFAHEDPPELILLDIRLPDMDGFEVCRRLTEDQKTDRVPVIFLSALDEMGDKVKGFVAGGRDYITKPYQAIEVLARVETHLALSRLQKQVEARNAQFEEEILKTMRAEQALRKTHDELEERVKERTADLAVANEQLVASAKALEGRLEFESLLADISGRFVNLPVDQVEGEMKNAQRRICGLLHVDRSTFWLAPEEDQKTLRLVHIHPDPEDPPLPERMNARDFFPWSVQKVLRGEVLTLSRMADLPPEAPRDHESYRLYGTKSTVVLPLSTGGSKPFGALSFATTRQEQAWPESALRGLQLIAQVFANALERKRADQVLRTSEERLSMAADFTGIGLWSVDLPTRHLWSSQSSWDLLGLDRGVDLTEELFFSLIHPEDHKRVRQSMEEVTRSNEETARTEYRIVCPDGSIRWIVSRARAHFTVSGEPDRLMGVSIDITERKQMEEQLRSRLLEIEHLKERLEKENVYLQEEVKLLIEQTEIVGQSVEMKKVLAQAAQVARTESIVLLLGETGTGKGLLARAIHGMSARKDRPLVTINCASLAPTLIESELFGREKGAYTGALTRTIGRFEIADGASLFLDEIGEIPFELQSKLLRILETGQFERLGSTKSMHIDVRIIAATNRDLSLEVANGKFRRDLFYRLNVFPIVVPPLRDRPEDIPPMVWAFVREFQERMGKEVETISRKSMDALQSYSWPGNARELRNVVERAMIVGSSKTLVIPLPKNPASETSATGNLEETERKHILSVLQRTAWRVGGEDGAARVLGLKRSTLYSKMKKLGIKIDRSTF
jgi:formate hydrogenlyase transcriptional activator